MSSYMRILIVDDDAGIRSLLKIGLEAEGFVIDEAAEGNRGSYLARTNDYDLIILDLILPKKDGKEICKEVRNLGKTTPILAISVNATAEQKINLLNYGADDYI